MKALDLTALPKGCLPPARNPTTTRSIHEVTIEQMTTCGDTVVGMTRGAGNGRPFADGRWAFLC